MCCCSFYVTEEECFIFVSIVSTRDSRPHFHASALMIDRVHVFRRYVAPPLSPHCYYGFTRFQYQRIVVRILVHAHRCSRIKLLVLRQLSRKHRSIVFDMQSYPPILRFHLNSCLAAGGIIATDTCSLHVTHVLHPHPIRSSGFKHGS